MLFEGDCDCEALMMLLPPLVAFGAYSEGVEEAVMVTETAQSTLQDSTSSLPTTVAPLLRVRYVYSARKTLRLAWGEQDGVRRVAALPMEQRGG